MKFFPVPILEILPVAVIATEPSGCPIEAPEGGMTRDPVVAPAGTVLRVRLMETPGNGRGRPGDRFRSS